jgi:predicted ATP-binding protein involved in virulence
LSTFDSFAIIATHSPLIIQQIPAAYVRVFTRIENQTLIRELTEESFGENLSVLSETVFQVNATESLFRWWLKSLPQNISEARISKAFSKGLSFDAKSVIRTVLASRRREN